MKTNMSETSLKAIRDIRKSGKTLKQSQKIIYHMSKYKKPRTRAQIALMLGIDKGSIAGRINSLIKSGAVMETVKEICPTSGRIAWLVKLTPKCENS